MKSKTRFIVPNAFTSLNFLLGVFAICWASGAFTPKSAGPFSAFLIASNFVIYSALLDKLDGFAAKLMNASSEFGAQLDSLADLVAFGLAPALSLFFAYKSLAPQWFEINAPFLVVGVSIYTLATAIRLAKYNAMDSDSLPDYFMGMPSTFAGAFNALGLILLCNYNFWEMAPSKFLHLPLVMLVGSAILMVAPLYIPKLKPRKSKWFNWFQIANITLVYICGFAMIFPEYLFALILCYAVFGFGYGLLKRETIAKEQKELAAAEA